MSNADTRKRKWSALIVSSSEQAWSALQWPAHWLWPDAK
jgi:hypothetical protein